MSHFATPPTHGLAEKQRTEGENQRKVPPRLPSSLFGTLGALTLFVRIAISIWQQRISPVLDAASRLLLVTRPRGREAERKELDLRPLPAEDLARNVAEQGVDVLLCALLKGL